MTKQDFELFANEIHKRLQPHEQADVIEICASVFSKSNPSFNRSKFETACREGKFIRKSIAQGVK